MRKELLGHLTLGLGIALGFGSFVGCSEGSESTHSFSSAALEVGEEGGDIEATLPQVDLQDAPAEGEGLEADGSVDTASEELSFCAAYESVCGEWGGDVSCEEWWEAAPAGEEGEEGPTQACYWSQLNQALDGDSVEAVELACIGAVGDSPPCVEED